MKSRSDKKKLKKLTGEERKDAAMQTKGKHKETKKKKKRNANFIRDEV